MVLEGLAWNTSPGAWDVEPPGAGKGPWSTTVTSVQPRAESSSARAAPTTPAPMITTRAPVMPLLPPTTIDPTSGAFVGQVPTNAPFVGLDARSVAQFAATARHVCLQLLADRIIEGRGL